MDTVTETENVEGPAPKAKKKAALLIPNAEVYVENGMNVLLIGKHGTGKTATVRDIGERLGLNVKAYSCATLDPFTDLVGVPVPRTTEEGDVLRMIRPKDIDEADIVFFDELNRARPEVQNAVLEIINNRTINGELLPRLKCCWAAINPAGDETEDYKVDELDPALMDRFHAFLNFNPRPSVSWMENEGDLPRPVAKALKEWWDDHNASKRDSYISPRRLHIIGKVFMAHKTKRSIQQAMIPDSTTDVNKLYQMLRAAVDPNRKDDRKGTLGESAAFDFSDKAKVKADKDKIVKFLQDNQDAFMTHDAASKFLRRGMGGTVLVDEYADMLDSLKPAVLESLVTSFTPPKRSNLKNAFEAKMNGSKGMAWAKKHQNLHAAINNSIQQEGSKLPPLS